MLDSLYNAISKQNDTTQIKILSDLCWEYRSTNPTMAIRYGKLALGKVQKYPESKYFSLIYSSKNLKQ